MFASLVGLIHQPSIAIRVPNDDSTFNPKEYPSLAFVATGKVQGKVRLIHGTEDDSGLGMISTRIWVTKESDKEEVAVRLTFDNKTHTLTLEGPTRFGSFNIYHETTIQIPQSYGYMENLRVEAPNTSLSSDSIDHLTWSSVHSQLSNATIALESLHADKIALHTSNSSISGRFEGGHIELDTSNGSISAKLNMQEAQDGRQSAVTTKTSNASINLHVDATQTTQGLWMENETKNGKVVLGTLLGHASRSSYINTSTANAKIEFSLDASQTGQALEVNTKTTNGSILSSVMVPQYYPFKGVAQSSNGAITVNLTEDFQGRFDLETSNSSAIIEGSNVHFEHDKKGCKRGSRGQGASEVKITTSNAHANLRFYPVGDSLASDSKMQQ